MSERGKDYVRRQARLVRRDELIRAAQLRGVELPRRVRAKIRGRVKRRFGLNRRQVGAIGAGHLDALEYENTVAAEIEHERFRRLDK